MLIRQTELADCSLLWWREAVPDPGMLPEEVFEDDYTLKFKQLVLRRGLLASFDRDRARRRGNDAQPSRDARAERHQGVVPT